jgi:bifunctional ADP-heptose synthase (sugar kinase/adenylyltransferase)
MEIIHISNLGLEIEKLKKLYQAILLCIGDFDLLQKAHLNYLLAASQLGFELNQSACLIVGVWGDALVQQVKGPNRPFLPAEDRAGLIAQYFFIKGITIYGDPNLLIATVQPDYLVITADLAKRPEVELVQKNGGKIITLNIAPVDENALLQKIRG